MRNMYIVWSTVYRMQHSENQNLLHKLTEKTLCGLTLVFAYLQIPDVMETASSYLYGVKLSSVNLDLSPRTWMTERKKKW